MTDSEVLRAPLAAVPHPQVADDKLYRSTDASDPLAKRLRAILSWASQRTRGRVLAPALPDGGDEVERAAREVVDGWVDDVCRLRVDTSVPFSVRPSSLCPAASRATSQRADALATTQEPSASQDPASLPPHPQNEANAARLVELEAAYAACVLSLPVFISSLSHTEDETPSTQHRARTSAPARPRADVPGLL